MMGLGGGSTVLHVLSTFLNHQLRLAFQEIRSSFSSQYYSSESLIALETVDVYL